MEEEINNSTVVFKDKAPKYGEAAGCSCSRVLPVCIGILFVLLVARIGVIVYFHVEMNEQQANLNDITAANEKLIVEQSLLEQEMRNLSRVADNLNWTLGFILKFDIFQVNDYCPEKILSECQQCQKDWILFQEKCYLIYNEGPPWKTWAESRKYCQTTKADLVVIDNLQEQEFISNNTEFYFDKFHGYWIGLKETEDNYWVWVDGRNDTLGYWQEENLGTPGSFALMIPGRNPTASWRPANGLGKNRFICENDAVKWST